MVPHMQACRGVRAYCLPRGEPPAKFSLGDFYMTTSGFASTWLYLSPAEQHDSCFRYFGIQAIRDRECHVMGFAHAGLIAGSRVQPERWRWTAIGGARLVTLVGSRDNLSS